MNMTLAVIDAFMSTHTAWCLDNRCRVKSIVCLLSVSSLSLSFSLAGGACCVAADSDINMCWMCLGNSTLIQTATLIFFQFYDLVIWWKCNFGVLNEWLDWIRYERIIIRLLCLIAMPPEPSNKPFSLALPVKSRLKSAPINSMAFSIE